MDKQHIKGATQKVEGAIKDAAGKLTGSLRLRAAGKVDKAMGAARQATGDVKEAGARIGDAFRR